MMAADVKSMVSESVWAFVYHKLALMRCCRLISLLACSIYTFPSSRTTANQLLEYELKYALLTEVPRISS